MAIFSLLGSFWLGSFWLGSFWLCRNASSPGSSLQIARSFLPPGFSCLYKTDRAVVDVSSLQTPLCTFIADFCPLILEPLLAKSEALDWKGGGADDTLVRVVGQLQLEEEALPFTYTVATRFKDFPNRNQIRFDWEERCSLEELEGIPLQVLCGRQDISISSFGFRLENFQSNILTRLSGFGPVVSETLHVEITASQFSLTLRAEGLTSPHQPPLTREALFEKMNVLIERCYQFSIYSDYTSLKGELL